MTRPNYTLFISWARDCSRSDGIARQLGGKSLMIYAPRWGSRYITVAFKYAEQMLQTFKALFRERPRTVLVMTPPVIACIPIYLYCVMSGAKFIIDAHTGAFLDRRWRPLTFLHAFFSRRALRTLVTNNHLEELVTSWGARPALVPDVPIEFETPANEWPVEAKYNFTLVNTFGPDEPVALFLRAVKDIPDTHFFITGDVSGFEDECLESRPANVTFTGFLSREDYTALMQASDAIISLTTFDHTMQRGAYEAIYLGRPVITSNFELLRNEFDLGTVHVDINEESIRGGIARMIAEYDSLSKEVQVLRDKKLTRWREVSASLLEDYQRKSGGAEAPNP